MVPQDVVERLAATLRDEPEVFKYLDLDADDLYTVASRALEVATTELQLDWPAADEQPKKARRS